MVNIIKSDIFRIKKGSAVRNVFLAGIIIIVITGVNMLGSSSGFGGVGVQSTASAARSLPGNGAEFVQQMRDDGLFPFFILAFAVAVLGAEYSTGTIRNSLSYFVDRRNVFFAKCVTGFLCCLTYTTLCLVVSFAAGTILFGFGGFTLTLIARILVQILLSTPLYIGMIAIGNGLLVFTKKTSITITTYLIGLIAFPSVTYQIYQLFPKAEWLTLCDPLSAFSMLSRFWEFPIMTVGMVLLFWVILDALLLFAGAQLYADADIA
ncbi:ABC transporter permease subunit [Enterococcus sp. AZ196]|uniref:ABC transporter permease subunit n=1 Tax=Enterococcus sp. AZ196 TaxID=2774659 RepID=UPI003D26BA61